MGAGVESVALEELEDTVVVRGREFCEWESCGSGCEKGEVLISWRHSFCHNKDIIKENRRLRPYLDRRQRKKRAEATIQ